MPNAIQIDVCNWIFDERERQDKKWGEQNHPDGTSAEYRWIADAYRESCELSSRAGELTWHDILMEEVFEALAETDPEKLELELIQAAAVIVAWVEKLRRHRNDSKSV